MLVQDNLAALLVTSNPLFTNRRVEIVVLAARHALPAGYAWREFVEAGGLIGYGPNVAWAYRHIGEYASRILKMLWGCSGEHINQSITNPTFTRRIEEKASERRSGFSLEFFASCAWTKRPCF